MVINQVDGPAGQAHHLRYAQWLAFALPVALLGGAYISQYGFGLFPCEMCWWQRYPHFAALALAVLAWGAKPRRLWLCLAALAILSSGVIGAFHAGVEYGWWQGITSCALTIDARDDPLTTVLNAPLTRCDAAPWHFLGISLAGWNALISGAGGLAILWLLAHKDRHE